MQSNPVNAGSTVTVGAMNRTPSAELDKDAFMKLMIAQLQHQDPTAPQDSTQMMAQVSQMTMVEQITNLATTAAAQAKDAKLARSEALLGRTVTYVDKDKASVSGVVEKVDTSGDTPRLTINGVDGIDPATLTEVR
jgi:flagellar basal-body rod modification protein FlgD